MENYQMSGLFVVVVVVIDIDWFREFQVTVLSQDSHAVITPSPGHSPLFKDAYP